MMFATHRIQSNPILRGAVIACAAGVVLLGSAGLAHAGEGRQARDLDEAPSTEVYYGDLNLATEEGSRVLYSRIVKAAYRVCPLRSSADLSKAALGRQCAAQAIERAVRDVGNEKVAALNAARAKRASRS